MIRRIIQRDDTHRAQISREVCRRLGWLKPDGGLKEMSSRVALHKLHRLALIELPPPRHRNGNGAWHIEFTAASPRDNFIGWTKEQRISHLHLVVNNSRFLILPWVHVKNLASKVLSQCAKQLPNDWHSSYGYTPVLLETFVEKERFAGTCYKAANWCHVGQTQGRGKSTEKTNANYLLKLFIFIPSARTFVRF